MDWAQHDGEVVIPLVTPPSPGDEHQWRWRYPGEANIRQGRTFKLQIVYEGIAV